MESTCCVRVYLNDGGEWGKWNLHVVSECIRTLVQNRVSGIYNLYQSVAERGCRMGKWNHMLYQNASERWWRMGLVEFTCCVRVYLNDGAEWGKWNLHVVSKCI